jgi:anaerobic dimethyl sulfoxide reductase subunit C (anchor subunit)
VAVVLVIVHGRLQNKTGETVEKQKSLVQQVLQAIAIVCVILLGIQFLVLPVYLAYLATQGSAALASLSMMVGPFLNTLILRLVLIFAGAGLLGTYLHRNAGLPGKEKSVAALTYGAFVLVLAGEVMGRILFYATHVRIGL